MTNVYITVDTEVWPRAHGWPHTPLPADAKCEREIDCYFWGGNSATKLGLPFQLQTLVDHGLKATFFVDPLFSYALGLDPLKRVVEAIQSHGQEVGLHMHPEWLTDPRMPKMPAFRGPYMREYDDDAQRELIGKGIERLRAAGAADIKTFRAGSWGANLGTLRALAHHGIRVDSSLNACYDASLPDLQKRTSLLQPFAVEGISEFPLTYFTDRPPTGKRELQICACSSSELEHVLESAYAEKWNCVVIVSHSFEFVRVNQLHQGKATVGPMRLLGRRFRSLCKYLAANRDRFQTGALGDASPQTTLSTSQPTPLHSNHVRTVGRMISQAVSLVY